MGHVGAARRSVYCASKHAMEGFTKAMAIELAPHDIRVNTLGPTFLETPLTKPFFENAAFKAEVLAKIKLGRLGKVEDVLGACCSSPPTPPRCDRHLARRRRRLDGGLRATEGGRPLAWT